MRAESIAVADLTDDAIERWRDLAARAVEPNPFHEPEYVLALARGVGQLDRVGLAVVKDSGGWRACLPVHICRWHRIPLRSLAMWRGHPFYSLLGTPLVDPDRPSEALAALLGELASSRRASFVALEWVGVDGVLLPALEEVLGGMRPPALCFERFTRAAIRRRPEPTYFDATLSVKHRAELRRKRRRLAEAAGAELVMVDRANDSAAYDEFIALEAAAGHKRIEGTVIGADRGHTEFFREMCREFAALGRLQLPFLRAGDQTIASQCNLIAGDTVFGLKIAYDERWRAYSPGIQLDLEMIDAFHEHPELRMIDSDSAPNNESLNLRWPDRHELASYVLLPPGLRGAATGSLIRAARSARDWRTSRR